MDALSAMRSLADLQAKFQPERLLSFDPESLLAIAADVEASGDISPTHEYHHATFESSSAAQLFDYRGEKVAGFDVNGVQMICLPQVYELFLKNMVGGLHTVYTKLKRLEITPLICNVEQVRALRGLGAIQPGVNRCKLIASNDFDRLYEDCTNTCTRPGRPPKRVASNSIDEWTNQPKKEAIVQDDLSHLTVQNPLLLGNFLPQFTAHQLLMQHMMALAQQKHLDGAQQTSSNAEDASSDVLSSDIVSGASVEATTPLNLTKANSNSETCDSDSLDNMRKVDASLSPSQYNSSDRGGSSSANGSNNSPSSETSAALNKINMLVDMANEHFKQQKEGLQKEREELSLLRSQLSASLTDERRLRHQLEMEQRKSATYFRRYCKARKEAIELKERLISSQRTSQSSN